MTPAPPQGLEGLVNLDFQLDARVFAVMAAATAAGLDVGAPEGSAVRVRAEVATRLAGLNPDVRSRLAEFRGVRAAVPSSAYVSLALFLGPGPRFELRAALEDLPPDVQLLAGFERLVAEVWDHAALNELWDRLRPDYMRAVEAYRGPIRNLIVDTLRYLRTEPRIALDRQVTFIPDLLNGAGVVNARNIGPNYVVMVGPDSAGRKPLGALRHEYLHFMVDPLVVKYEGHLPEPEPFLRSVKARRKPRAEYEKDLPLVVTESLIRALELRLDRHTGPREDEALAAGFEEGLILLPYFLGELGRFESGTGSLQEAFPELVRGIRWDREKGRADEVARTAGALESRRAAAAEQPSAAEEARAELRARLVRANALLQARDHEAARTLLEEVLRIAPDNASALFGLAQAAGARQDLDQALELYARAAERAGPEQWIAAWSYVRRGNIFRFQGDEARARAEWEKVLALADLPDTRTADARKAAAQALGVR